VARETLRAYLKAGCNASSAASALGVVRHTVESRVRAVEQILDKGLNTCLSELEVALRLHELLSDRNEVQRAKAASLGN
jgi:DNA-binding PucR family transcriptional regulator